MTRKETAGGSGAHTAKEARDLMREIIARKGPITLPDLNKEMAREGRPVTRETLAVLVAADAGRLLPLGDAVMMRPATTALLRWDKPPQARPTGEHNKLYGGDDAPPGVYVPNMDEDWNRAWKARMLGQRSPGLGELRVEIRKAAGPALVKAVACSSGEVLLSMNGTAEFTAQEWAGLHQAVEEARAEMRAFRESRKQIDG